jgi:hypothetical protein
VSGTGLEPVTPSLSNMPRQWTTCDSHGQTKKRCGLQPSASHLTDSTCVADALLTQFGFRTASAQPSPLARLGPFARSHRLSACHPDPQVPPSQRASSTLPSGPLGILVFLPEADGDGKTLAQMEREHRERGQAVIRCADFAG